MGLFLAVMTILGGIAAIYFFWEKIVAWFHKKSSLQVNKKTHFDRRLKIHDAITSFIADIKTSGTTNNQRLVQLLKETKHAKFLFNEEDKIPEYINKLYEKGSRLECASDDIKSLRGEQRNNMIKKRQTLLKWFGGQYRVVEEKFKPYLKLD